MNMHILGMWEDTGVPRENPCGHGENVQSPHRQRPCLGIDFFAPHQCYNETTLNKMTLLKDLLCLPVNQMKSTVFI